MNDSGEQISETLKKIAQAIDPERGKEVWGVKIGNAIVEELAEMGCSPDTTAKHVAKKLGIPFEEVKPRIIKMMSGLECFEEAFVCLGKFLPLTGVGSTRIGEIYGELGLTNLEYIVVIKLLLAADSVYAE